MTILNIPPSKRFREWKRFRDTLTSNLSDDQQLTLVAKYWSDIPLVQFYVDWDQPKNWPEPWQLIHEGQLCATGVAICMYHTLLYVTDQRWDGRLQLELIKDEEQGIFIVVVADNQWVLNYALGGIVAVNTLGNKVDRMETYTFVDGIYVRTNRK
jgi:hypothetical protein